MNPGGRVIIDEDMPYKIICAWWIGLFKNTIYNNMSRDVGSSKNPDRLEKYIGSINRFTNKFVNDDRSINTAVVSLHQSFSEKNYADTIGMTTDRFVKFYVNLFIPSHTIEAIGVDKLHGLKKKLMIETLFIVSNLFSRTEYASVIVYQHGSQEDPRYISMVKNITRQLLEDIIAMRKSYNDKCNMRSNGQDDLLKKLKARIYTVESEKRELSDKVNELRDKFRIVVDRYTHLATTYNGLLEYTKKTPGGASIMLQPVPIHQTPSLAPSVRSASSSTKAAAAAGAAINTPASNERDSRADRYVNNVSNILVGKIEGSVKDGSEDGSDEESDASSELSISDAGGDDDDL